MDEGKYYTIDTSAIPEVTKVRYYAETVSHITEEHAEFRGELPVVMGSIIDTVENPTAVYRSNTAPTTSFVFSSSRNTFRGMAMFVPVKVIQETSAVLKTAYYSDDVKGTLLFEESNES